MSNNEWPDSRFLFSDMFSLSFEPEILTFLWGICSKKADDIQRDYRYLFPTSSLLRVFVPFQGQRTNFQTFLSTTVITGGTLVGVGFSSYGAFKILQKLRYEGFQGVKDSLTKIIKYWNTPDVKSNSLELVLVRPGATGGRDGINPSTCDLIKRPSDLSLNGHSNGFPSPGYLLQNRLNGNSKVPMDSLSVSPINGDIASGDEDGAEVQGQYFGPPLDTPNKCNDPDDVLREKYELLRNPLCLTMRGNTTHANQQDATDAPS